MTTSVFERARRRHALLDGSCPGAQLYLQHRGGRWGQYVQRDYNDTVRVTFPGGTELAWWSRSAICASVVTARRIW